MIVDFVKSKFFVSLIISLIVKHFHINNYTSIKDVCDVLDIAWRGQQTLVNIREDWKGVRNFRTPGGIQEMIVIKEPAVYKLAFRSRKEEAERFTDWVAGEVIPSIRKTGRYELYPHKPQCIEDLIIMQAQSVKELKARVEKQEKMLQIAQHRLDNLDAVNLEGDLRQRLNQMIKKYAFERGITLAWYEKKLNSYIGLRGIVKKVMMLFLVAVAVQIDIVTKTNGIMRSAVICFMLANEGLSILENLTRMDIGIPPIIKQALETLKSKGEKSNPG
ncbi:MAG: hypothetical protein PWP75_1047 [Caldanaerobacter sp.]|nr:hypothetical protein [Caldanaerobacter sp.]